MIKFKQYIKEDTVNLADFGDKKVWFRIDGGNPLYWETIVFHGKKIVETHRFYDENEARKSFYELIEDIKVPVGPGDWILGGKFKNKKIKIKSVTTNAKGDILINGRPMMKFRIPDAETQKRLKADEKK